jgi:hypothetical protein
MSLVLKKKPMAGYGHFCPFPLFLFFVTARDVLIYSCPPAVDVSDAGSGR